MGRLYAPIVRTKDRRLEQAHSFISGHKVQLEPCYNRVTESNLDITTLNHFCRSVRKIPIMFLFG